MERRVRSEYKSARGCKVFLGALALLASVALGYKLKSDWDDSPDNPVNIVLTNEFIARNSGGGLSVDYRNGKPDLASTIIAAHLQAAIARDPGSITAKRAKAILDATR